MVEVKTTSGWPKASRRLYAVAVSARDRPSFALYLTAITLFPFQWLSPFSYEQAGWPDVFIAGAAASWFIEACIRRPVPLIRWSYYWYGAYLLLVTVSAGVAVGRGGGAARNVIITAELVALAVMTADYS
jgi:hypothetical protein